MSKPETQLATLADRARAIDVISSRAIGLFDDANSFEKELAVAQAVGELRTALTAEVMQPIMQLMNTGLGFRTDRNPDKDKSVTPYPVEVVREVFIEARLRGFNCVGNEFNIIAGNFYGAQNGFVRKVKNHPKVTDVKEWFDVPRNVADKGAVIKCRLEWRFDLGAVQSLEREFAIRVNAGQGADAIIGKAKRKLYAAVWERITGKITPEADADDAIEVKSTVVTEATPTEELFKQAAPTNAGPQTAEASPQPPKASEPAATPAPPSEPAPAQPKKQYPATPQGQLAEFVEMNGFTLSHFHKWAKDSGQLAVDVLKSFDDVPAEKAVRWIGGAKAGLIAGLKAAKKALGT